ncbi:HAD family hydrolase [Lactococcus termiticola]|uniref:Beta-phosphoglucomutase n=1 Tax=Lactococcus termiticola TaxID=2169526 RepID=A0A2R5HF31_9LACT|nr:HAD family phosphatase [Lactococcus termiticola]GBG96654.1 beta-phosphoglucomutase [Lactococcus termiticola]
MTVKAIIFDMDGVLVDTENYYLKRREDFFASQGISLAGFPHSFFIGGKMQDVWDKILGDAYSPEEKAKILSAYDKHKKGNVLPYTELLFPDVRDILEFLKNKGIRMALASSTAMSDIEHNLKVNELAGYFELLRSGSDLKHSKPDPEIYLITLEALGLAKDEVIVIEDSEKGIASAKAAGLECWAIKDDRFGMNQEAADQIFPSLTAVKEKLAEML